MAHQSSGTRYEVIAQKDNSSENEEDIIIPLPLPLLKQLGWKDGDELDIGVDAQGQLFLRKASK